VVTFTTSREISAPPEQVFAALAHPQRLARWWGPDGFTNTFDVCEFTPGGCWSFVMHGPDGATYPNESVFAEIAPPTIVVVQHVSEPKFRLSVTLSPSATGTTVAWEQVFEDSEFARRVEHIVVPANDQNLQRLEAEVLRPPHASP
jgi:uncharacterized protein YndB with AHSA1/START domain